LESSLYHIVAPFDEKKSGLHPGMILLHGRGTNEEDLMGLVPYLDPRLVFVAARAPFYYPHGGFTWYDLQSVGAPDQTQFLESYERLAEFLTDVPRRYPVDPKQIFLLGFSMGTVLSFALSLMKPEAVKGVVAHSGYLPETMPLAYRWENLANTSFFVAHGTEDPVIPIHFGRRANELLSKTNAPLVYKEYPIQHQISEASLTDLSGWLTNLVGPLKT
jgi:phospholipase/carboxylesterase